MEYLDVEKLSLGVSETPLQYLANLSKDLGVELYIKRDDLNGIGLGGNKVRKLNYLIKDAIDKKATMLITVGGTQTNHGRLTAAFAAKMNMKSAIIMIGNKPESYTGNMILDQMLGSELYYIDPSQLADSKDYGHALSKAIEEKFKEIKEEKENEGETVYTIPMGGSNPLGALGYVDGLGELHGQCHDLNLSVDYIICAYGSVGTYAGLLLGTKFYQMDAKVIGMNVLHDFDHNPELEDEHFQYLEDINRIYEMGLTLKRKDFHVVHETIRKGYNIPDEKTKDAVLLMARKEAIFLDYCYSGKAFSGLLDKIETGDIEKGSTVVLVHTGGTPGIFSDTHVENMNRIFK